MILYLLLYSLSCTAGESQIEKTDAVQSTSADSEATDLGTKYVATKF